MLNFYFSAREGSCAAHAVGDMARRPYRDGAFGGVLSACSIIHMTDRQIPLALSEMRRVLAPGGRLLLVVQGGKGPRPSFRR